MNFHEITTYLKHCILFLFLRRFLTPKITEAMSNWKVFVSYDHSEDLRYKNILRAWDTNTRFNFEFDQRSPNFPINSEDAGRVKAALTAKMKEADYLLVIVGKQSFTSDWMTWEINRAKMNDVGLKLAAVKIDWLNITPKGLLNCGTAFARNFTLGGIVDALDSATNNYLLV